MRLTGRRASTDVDNRRRMSGGKKATAGMGGIIVIVVITWLTGGNILSVLTNQLAGGITQSVDNAEYVPSQAEYFFAIYYVV